MGEPTELYPGHAAELARHQARAEAVERAAHEPLPGPLREVYEHIPETIAGLTVRPFVHYDFVILAKVESPLLQHLRGVTKQLAQSDVEASAARLRSALGETRLPPAAGDALAALLEAVRSFTAPDQTAYEDEQGYELIYQFTRPIREVRATLARGRGEYRETAIQTVAEHCGLLDAPLLMKAIERELVRAFCTKVNYETRGAEGSVFTRPPAAMTGSAGGNIISVCSSTNTPVSPATTSSTNFPAAKAGPWWRRLMNAIRSSNRSPMPTSPRNDSANAAAN